MIELQSVVAVRSDLLWSDVGGEVVIMEVDSGRYFNLDDIGSRIWRQIETPTDVASLCEALQQRHAAPLDKIRSDVIAFLDQMLEKSLIRLQS